MLPVTLLILQLVGLLTYPPFLISIFTGKNIVKLLDDIKCTSSNSDATDVAVCKIIRAYKWRMLIVMILYIISILFYSVAIYYSSRNSKVTRSLLVLGGIISVFGVILLVESMISMSKDASNILNCINQPQPCVKEDASGTKYFVLVCSLTIIFSLIAGLMGIFKKV
jgi:hypothetical protein